MGTWTLPALQGRADQSQWVARRQMTLHGHITELQSWGTRKPWTLVSVPPSPNPALFLSEAEFGLLKFCTLIKL